MSSTTSPTPATTDESLLVEHLTTALDAAKAELAELEPKHEQLSARVSTLEHTIAVYKGETPAPVRKRRASSRRKPAAKPAASEA